MRAAPRGVATGGVRARRARLCAELTRPRCVQIRAMSTEADRDARRVREPECDPRGRAHTSPARADPRARGVNRGGPQRTKQRSHAPGVRYNKDAAVSPARRCVQIREVSTEADRDARRIRESELIIDIEEQVLVAFTSIFARLTTATDAEGESCGVQLAVCAAVLTDPARESEFGCCEVDIRSDSTEFSPEATAVVGAPSATANIASDRCCLCCYMCLCYYMGLCCCMCVAPRSTAAEWLHCVHTALERPPHRSCRTCLRTHGTVSNNKDRLESV